MRTRHLVGFAGVLLATIAHAQAPSSSPPWNAPAQPLWNVPPVTTPLTTVNQDAVTIVIGVVEPQATGYVIHVEQVLRGNPPSGDLVVSQSPSGPLASVELDHVRAVAFIDRAGGFRWSAVPVDDWPRDKTLGPATLESSVLTIQGFYSTALAGHIVEPQEISLLQLRAFLATGQLDVTYDVTVASGQQSFTVRIDPLVPAPAIQVQGLHFSCLRPQTLYWPNHYSAGLRRFQQFGLSFDDTCAAAGASPRRTLRLGAWPPSRVDPSTGDIQVQARPVDPSMIDEDYADFVRDGSIVGVIPTFRVNPAAGDTSWKSWTWKIGVGLFDGAGVFHGDAAVYLPPYRATDSSQSITVERFDHPGGELTGGELNLGLGCRLHRPGAPDTACRLERVKSHFVRR